MKSLHKKLSKKFTWYRRWHKSHGANYFHWGIFICITILLGSSIYYQIQRLNLNVSLSTSSAATNPTTEPLVSISDLTYQGSFRLPHCPTYASCGGASFDYAGLGIGYNSANDSLFLNGYDGQSNEGYVAEVAIPTGISATNTTLTSLPTATFKQQFSDAFEGHMRDVETDTSGKVKVGGILPYNGKLYLSDYVYYDANSLQQYSHFIRPMNLSTLGQVQGPYQVGPLGAGYYDGYFGLIPAEWQPLLGGPVLNGNCCLSIITRTSFGPGVFAIDPTHIGTAADAAPLIYYTQDHQLGSGYGTQSNLFNGATVIDGVVFPVGTRSVLFFGKQGFSPECYGQGTGDTSLNGTLVGPSEPGVIYCYDPEYSSKGSHAYPYSPYVWAYDANDLAAVKAGTKQPWEIVPYAIGDINLHFSGGDQILGSAYDPATGRIFLVQEYGNSASPIVDVFKLNANLGSDTQPPTTPTNLVASAVSTTQINLSWTASTDNVAVTGYKVFRDGVQITLVNNNSYSNTGLTPSHTYSYTVLAVDGTGNASGQSGAATAKTNDAPPPSSSGTRVPPAASLNDNSGNAWTLGSNSAILENGTSAAGGLGSKILWYQNNIYVFGVDSKWYQWTGSGWTSVGPNDPQGVVPLSGDLNLDHIVNSLDWSLMNSKWFTTDANADLNHDGLVNAIDFSMLNANWFKTW